MAAGIVRPKAKPKTLPPMRPNAGLELEYRRALERLVDEMHKSLVWWLTAAYRANEPEIAQDAPDAGGFAGPALPSGRSPAVTLSIAMKRLAKKWQKRFDDAAPDLAKHFATAAAQRSDASLRAALKKAGITVRFRMDRATNDVVQANVAQNVSLIKSIAAQHLSEVEGLVMRSVTTGRDVGALTKALQARYAITKRRAAFVARDQNNKATATVQRARQQQLGITHAVWLHSHGGKHPRPEHLAFNGKTYEIAKGAFLEGKWTWPGVEINCRCVCKPIIPGL